MADDCDLAQALIEERTVLALAEHRARPRPVGICEECEDEPCFVTELGTVTRICRTCHAQRRG